MKSSAHAAPWLSEKLSNVLETVIDYRGISVPKSGVGIPLITAKNVRNGVLDFSVKEFIAVASYQSWMTRGTPLAGDILFTTEAPLGMVAHFPKNGCFALGQRVVALRPKPSLIDSGYLLQFLLSPVGQKRIDLFSTGSTAKGISSGQLHKLVIDFPPLSEQKILAAGFRFWDECIESTERLIVAKTSSQKGLMQRLLRNDQVSPYRLSDFVDRVTRKNTTGNNHPLTISGKDGLVSQSQYFDKRIAAETTEHYTLLKRGEYAYNKSYSAGYPYGAIKRLDAHDEGIVSSLYLCFALKEEAPLLSDYLAYYCESGGFNHQIHRYAQEGARNHGLLNVATKDFFAMTMPLPSPQQQARVVEILNASARELTLLRGTLQHLKDQKRGLMQKLLTGQWRIKPSSSKE